MKKLRVLNNNLKNQTKTTLSASQYFLTLLSVFREPHIFQFQFRYTATKILKGLSQPYYHHSSHRVQATWKAPEAELDIAQPRLSPFRVSSYWSKKKKKTTPKVLTGLSETEAFTQLISLKTKTSICSHEKFQLNSDSTQKGQHPRTFQAEQTWHFPWFCNCSFLGIFTESYNGLSWKKS